MVKKNKKLEFSQKAFISIMAGWVGLILTILATEVIFKTGMDTVEVIRILVAIPITTIGVFGGKWGYENGKKISNSNVEQEYEQTNSPV